VLTSCALMFLLLYYWQPIDRIVWDLPNLAASHRLERVRNRVLLVPLASLMISHLRPLWHASGLVEPARPGVRTPAIPHAVALQPCAAPAVRRVDHRLLGDADDVGSVTCCSP
jgi:hypothetical protein